MFRIVAVTNFFLILLLAASSNPNPVATTNYKKIKAPIRAVQTVQGDMIQGVPQREALALIMVASKTDI